MKNTLLNIFSFLFDWKYYRAEFLVLEPSEGRLINKVMRTCRKTNFFGKELKQRVVSPATLFDEYIIWAKE